MASKVNDAQRTQPVNTKHSIQVISRAAHVLRALEGEKQGLSLGQIAQRVGLARSTVQRIVDALSEEHFLIPATPTAGVRLGPALRRLAESARVEFDDLTRPLLVELSQSIGETVDLSVLKNQGAVFTDQVQGAHRLRTVSHVGETFPLHCTANGKALLSVADPRRLERALHEKLDRLTPHTNTDPVRLEKEIRTIRRTLIAYDLEEHTEGICAVGTAFLDPLGRAVSVSIPVPTTRFKRLQPRLEAAILHARAKMLEALGAPQS